MLRCEIVTSSAVILKNIVSPPGIGAIKRVSAVCVSSGRPPRETAFRAPFTDTEKSSWSGSVSASHTPFKSPSTRRVGAIEIVTGVGFRVRRSALGDPGQRESRRPIASGRRVAVDVDRRRPFVLSVGRQDHS